MQQCMYHKIIQITTYCTNVTYANLSEPYINVVCINVSHMLLINNIEFYCHLVANVYLPQWLHSYNAQNKLLIQKRSVINTYSTL